MKALFHSLLGQTEAEFHCLITDITHKELDDTLPIQYHFLDQVEHPLMTLIKKKYIGNKLRWACKSLFILDLLKKFESVIYVDNDICFYASPDFLFDQLKERQVLLTPHYYPADPTKNQNWMEANFRVGLYNGGFVGASKNGKDAIEWWAECCFYNIKKSFRRGLFDDQKYLDLLPVLFENVDIIKHKGCNVAGWNIETSPRCKNEQGAVMLDEKWPLVFVHYNYYTIDCILNDKDPFLNNAWEQYLKWLYQNNPSYSPKKEIRSFRRHFWEYFDYLRYRINRLTE